jgi:hypothetical protein
MGNNIIIPNKMGDIRSNYRNRTDEVYSSFDIKHLDFYPKEQKKSIENKNVRSDYRKRTEEVYSSFDIKHLDFYPRKNPDLSDNLAMLLLM